MGKSYIDENGDALELDAEWFARSKPSSEIPELADLVRRGRPPLAEDARKQPVRPAVDVASEEHVVAGGERRSQQGVLRSESRREGERHELHR